MSVPGVRVIAASAAPAAIGPYSQAVRVCIPEGTSGLVFCSGQIGLDPAAGQLVEGGVEAETVRVPDHLQDGLEAAAITMADRAKTTGFLVSLADSAAMNRAYESRFGDTPPARSTIGVAALPRGARVEIEATAGYRAPTG